MAAATTTPEVRKERARMAQLLHDTICQELAGICLLASAAAQQCRGSAPETHRQLEEIADLIQRAGTGLGGVIRDLRGEDSV